MENQKFVSHVDYQTRKLEIANEILTAVMYAAANYSGALLGKAILEHYGGEPVEAAKKYMRDLTGLQQH